MSHNDAELPKITVSSEITALINEDGDIVIDEDVPREFHQRMTLTQSQFQKIVNMVQAYKYLSMTAQGDGQ